MLSRLIRRLLRKPEEKARGLIAATGALCVCGLLLTGCSSDSGIASKAGAISISTATSGSAKVNALTISSTATLSMTPTGDKANAGVDWTVICGGNPVSGSISNGACGTFTPTHTADGAASVYTAPSVVPVDTAVTITATVTSNPSQTSSVSLTILAAPISVQFTSTLTSSMKTNASSFFTARVTNDPKNAGVIWTATCSATTCGLFNPATTPSQSGTSYTSPSIAPTDGTVTITATSLTDTTKSVSTTVAITGSGTGSTQPISVSILPASAYFQTSGSARSVSFVAVVTNDTTNAGVNWTASSGSITSHTTSGSPATFTAPTTAPSGGTVTITATSRADTTKSAQATATYVSTAPVVVTMSSAPPTTLQAGTQATLAATTSPSSSAGVGWTATCGSSDCGSFSLSPAHTGNGDQIVYTAPGTIPIGSVVALAASSSAGGQANPAVAVVTITAPAPPPITISFAQAPAASLEGGARIPLSAIVANDAAAKGVKWTATCTNTGSAGCGWFGPGTTASGVSTTYTAPPVTAAGGSVTITATSAANSAVSVNSSPIVIAADVAVSFVPGLPAQIETSDTVNLIASVANDSSNAGVDWQVCASGCGFFTTKPATQAIEKTATTPYVPAQPAVTATSVSGWPNGSPIPYTAPAQAPDSGAVVIVASAHADATKANSGTIAVTSVFTGPALSGIVEAGTQPVAGAKVALLAAGTSGYASSSLPVTETTTDENGSFNLPAGYSCPQRNSQVYLVATEGQVGTNDANPNLALMTALGNCNALTSGPVVLNEITSVASAFATAPFAANDALTGNTSYLYIGSSSSNLAGLANAFAAVNNLVDVTTGQFRFVVPAANATVPYNKISTIADILNSCTTTTGGVEGDGSACGDLFQATDPLGTGTYNGSVAPSDTLQAAFNIAQHPVTQYGYSLDATALFALLPTSSPFQPTLSTHPSDWSLSLNYTGGGGLSSASSVGSFAIDANSNLWITDTTAGTVIEWNALGAALSPSTGYKGGGGPLAIDAGGNLWISGKGAIYELTNLGDPYPWSPFGGVAGDGSDMAIDAQSNVWITNGTGVAEFNALGQELSPIAGYANSAFTGTVPVAIDSAGDVWLGSKNAANSSSPYALAELSNPGGQLIALSSGTGLLYTVTAQIAADGSGNIWTPTVSAVCEMPPYGGIGTILLPTCFQGGGGGVGLSFSNPQGIALDGAGSVWIASKGTSTVSPSIIEIIPSLMSGSSPTPQPLVSQSLSVGPLRAAVDGAGNVWVLLADNTITEYVGVATPAVTPLALALEKNKIGARP